MRLNELSAGEGARRPRRRVGRGIGSGVGKTCGRGHKGQHSRSGGFHKVGFEGGQMPLQRRLPKRGFNSRKALTTAEIRTHELAKVEGGVVNLDTLRSAGLIGKAIKDVKIMLSGELDAKVTVEGLRVSKGAQKEIEKAGGKVETAAE